MDLIDAAMEKAAANDRDGVSALKAVAPIAIGVRPAGPADAEVFVTVNPLLRALLDQLGAVRIDERTFEIPTNTSDEASSTKLNGTLDVICGGHLYASDGFEDLSADGITTPVQDANNERYKVFGGIRLSLAKTAGGPAIQSKRIAGFHNPHPTTGPLSGAMVVIQSPEQEGATVLRITINTNPLDREAGLLFGDGDDAVNVHLWPYRMDTRLPVRVSAERASKAIADAERKGYPIVNADGTIKAFGAPTN